LYIYQAFITAAGLHIYKLAGRWVNRDTAAGVAWELHKLAGGVFMKAVIMAGGEGSRLRPLTCTRPKPMMPVLNRPIMHYTVELLKKHGFDEVGVTLQYKPDEIIEYFGGGEKYGIEVRYFLEDIPLGTAGSVKNAEEFLDDTFVVISGDALTDFDLKRAVEFHRERGAMATLVLAKVDCPLEYGVVITEESGRVRRFLEKPGWGEVFSDTVNTGIYILEPEVLGYFKKRKFFDFSKDLFPLLLEKKKPLYGIVLPGYWCDIGNLMQYVQSHLDVLDGRVNVKVSGRETKPGIWVGEGVYIDDSAKIIGPSFIGDGCQVGANAVIGPYAVLGGDCLVRENASVRRSVVWNNTYLGTGSELRGAVLGSRVKVQPRVGIYEGGVVGDNSVIKEGAELKPGVKVWPYKQVEQGSVVQKNLVWGNNYSKAAFGAEGITGLANVDITPEFAASAGTVFGSILKPGARVAVSSDNYPVSRMIKGALACGLQSAGVEVVDLGPGITSMNRYAVRVLECKGGVHIKIHPGGSDKVTLVFVDERGGNLNRSMERKIENILARGDFKRVENSQIIEQQFVPAVAESYMKAITEGIDLEALKRKGFVLVLEYDQRNLGRFVSHLENELGLQVERVGIFENLQFFKAGAGELVKLVAKKDFALGAALDENAENLLLVDERGRIVKDELLQALISLILLKSGEGLTVVPVTASGVFEDLAARYQGKVVRTKSGLQDFSCKVMELWGDNGDNLVSLLYFDGVAALIKILDFLAKNNTYLSALVDEVPPFFLKREDVLVPWQAKGRVIRELIESEGESSELELLDGVKIYRPEGWALVLPDPEKPVCRVFSEGMSMEIAESLTEMYVSKINEIAGNNLLSDVQALNKRKKK